MPLFVEIFIESLEANDGVLNYFSRACAVPAHPGPRPGHVGAMDGDPGPEYAPITFAKPHLLYETLGTTCIQPSGQVEM